MMAHVIGYTGEISEEELDLPEFAKYEPGAVIGKFGIERQYNDWLMGVDGQRQVVVDNRGQVRQVLDTKPAIAGKDLQLTIDLDLQAVAELAMDGRNGAVVALDPRTGEVLAMVSRPTFDPNKFAVRIKTKDWKEIARQPRQPHAEPRHSGAAGAGLDVQAHRGAGGARDRHHRRQVHRALPGRRDALRPLLPLLGEARATARWRCTTASCIPATSYFYTIGNKTGIDNIAFYARHGGFRAHHRDRSAARSRRGGALGAVEAAQLTGRNGTPARRLRWPSGRAR